MTNTIEITYALYGRISDEHPLIRLETYKELEWTERERRRLKEKSDRLRKELYQLKNKQS